MTVSEAIAAAGIALQLYNRLKKAAGAQGMDPVEFDAQALAECKRIDGWVAASNAAEDRVFTDAASDND